MVSRLASHLRRLQWKLTLSYVVVTVAAVLTRKIVGAVGLWYFVFGSSCFPTTVAEELSRETPQIASALIASPPHKETLINWAYGIKKEAESADNNNDPLDLEDSTNVELKALRYRSEDVFVLDTAGRVLASTDVVAGPPQSFLRSFATPDEASIAGNALRGRIDPKELSLRRAADAGSAAAPVFGKDGHVAGAVFVRYVTPVGASSFWPLLSGVLIPTALVVMFFAGIVGLGFGYLHARALTGRLTVISDAANAWSQGDFAVAATDRSPDEIGQLARRLNAMAGDLKSLVSLRQNLAAMEERNRLARDLHDTVKQQVFAASLQIGAASSLLDRDPAAAKASLGEAAGLVRQVHQELATILQELGPASSTQMQGGMSLRNCVADWSRRSGIPVAASLDAASTLEPEIEQAFLRITQEALANIARHSRATEVHVSVRRQENGDLALMIADNGCGISADHTPGSGLMNMRARAEELPRGRFSLANKPAQGVTITVLCRPEETK